ncbi:MULTISPECIES: sensor histidine kinase [Aquimarina]|uniref:sensor histidine kinase n=1 Tax=Aquimarina TaxID=290174 RepID=UPI001049E8FD|nr:MULTISPECIES: histidine kinase [Aquimarina]
MSKSIKFLTPTALLLMFRFYKNQQNYLKLNEQKKIAELTALKNQLNPHFLFNTLNNLYALAIKKSDHAPEVIEKLSDILDYMLYRCNNKFVSIQKEIELIENYIALEKIRYGNRVRISFKNNSTEDSKIAPLLLLTFIENAFKHGVTQELKEAFISITISSDNHHIIFNIENSKSTISAENKNQKCIGLSNVQKQLDLLYGDDYSLDIEEESDKYCVRLILKAK